MKVLLILFMIFIGINCQVDIPDEFKEVKDAIESSYYKETLEHIFKDQQFVAVRGGRIAGGEKASLGQFPFHALLYLTDAEAIRYVCGGVLIKYNLVLTAAHCIDGFEKIDIFLGVVDRYNGPAAWRSQSITNREHLIVHPNFDRRFLKNDIALVYLDDATEDILDHEHIELAQIPTFEEGSLDLTGMESTLSGFGITEDGKSSKILKYANLTIISNEECFETFPSYIGSSSLCTATSVRASPCQGDSGGPLTVQISPERKIIVGLTSFGSKYGCTSSLPVAFQRVSNHLNWLDDYLTNSVDEATELVQTDTTTPDKSSIPSSNVILYIILMVCRWGLM